MAEVATFNLRNHLSNVALNMDRRIVYHHTPANDVSLLPEIQPIFRLDLCIKQSHRLQLMDLHGVPRRTQTTPPTVVLNGRTEFPVTALWLNLTDLFSSVAQNVIPFPPDILYDTVRRIFTYAVDVSHTNPTAAIVHVKADLTVVFLTTEVQRPPAHPILAGRRDWVRVDESVVIAGEPVRRPVHPILAGRRDRVWIDDSVVIAGEPVGHPVDIPRQTKRRSARDLKERYGIRASDDKLGGDCAVCLEELVVGGGGKSSADVLKMPCSHVFHCRCISKWLNRSDSCPLCRSVIP